jgi:TATA-box binding protein (TBP) (component of TFIID and TFIIIB)
MRLTYLKKYLILDLLMTQNVALIKNQIQCNPETNNNQNKNKLSKSLPTNIIEFDLKELPDELTISTMTVTCEMPTLINIENVGKYIKLSNSGILSVKYGCDNIRSLIKIKIKKNSKKKKKVNFYNQATFVINIKNNKKVNLKLFKNGAIQMTGCKKIEHCSDALTVLCEELNRKMAVFDKKEGKILKKEFAINPEGVNVDSVVNFKIRMINSNFRVGFMVNRENLFNILSKAEIRCTFEPCIHACVNIKHYYKNEVISVFVFESGSVIITGAKTKDHITESHKFITKILYQHFNKIVKHDFDKFLERPDVVELIDSILHIEI